MDSNVTSDQPDDSDESKPKKIKPNEDVHEQTKPCGDENQSDVVDICLEIVFQGFKAPPVHAEQRELKDLPEFLAKYGSQITKLDYTDDAGEKNRQLIIKHCPNISEIKFEFTEYPDQVDDDESQRLVKFLTTLAPGLTRLETANNLIGLHYLSCMGYVYENFSSKIKFVKTDELKPEELSVLSGDNNKNNPALSLEELIYCDNDFLYSTKRNSRSAESLALRPAALTDLVKLTNLRRIDLPFFLSKEKIPPVTAPLPLLDYASIRLLSNNRGKFQTCAFTENIGKALANVSELVLGYSDPCLMLLTSTLMNCTKLKKLNLTDYHVRDDYQLGLAKLAEITSTFEQLDATIHSQYSHEIDVILHLINNVTSIATINIDGIDNDDTVNKLTAAAVALSEKTPHRVEVNLTLTRSMREKYKDILPKEEPENKRENLKSCVNFGAY